MTKTSRRLLSVASAFAACLILAGCGGNAPYSPIIADSSGDLIFTAQTPTATVEQGATATFHLWLKAVGTFSSSVTMTAANVPGDWDVSPAKVFTPTTSGTKLQFRVYTVGVQPGDYPFTVTVTGGGLTRRVNLTLKVTGLSVSIAPASQTIAPGGTAQYTVTVTPLNGHTRSANLEVSGLPSPFEWALNPTTVQFSGAAPQTSQLVISFNSGYGDPRSRGSGLMFVVTARSGEAAASATASLDVEDTGGIDAIIR